MMMIKRPEKNENHIHFRETMYSRLYCHGARLLRIFFLLDDHQQQQKKNIDTNAAVVKRENEKNLFN